MKSYFAYIRVSTAKQGEKGSSLQEQRSAISAYAERHGLAISEWFEEKETAAKSGRSTFAKMLRLLDEDRAAGVITHKIDRSARNLKDWATLGDLLDRGVELHFAHESIDLTSRGGRLSADIQAVVAADYIRNLRDEVRKGFYGRLKQGLYPLQAPLGYIDSGGGVPKQIDPVRGPLVAQAFDLYAAGRHSLRSIAIEMHNRGLRTRSGGRVARSGWSTILNNPFYIGLIRIKKTKETYMGVHEPLTSKQTFDAVHAVLIGKTALAPKRHHFQYQRMIRCASCGYSLIGERQKGHIYYRCHTQTCPKTSLREEHVDEALRANLRPFRLTEEEWAEVTRDFAAVMEQAEQNSAEERRSVDLAVAAVDDRLSRLTDAYLDQTIDKASYLARREQLLHDRTGLRCHKASLEAGNDNLERRAQRNLELAKALGMRAFWGDGPRIREIIKLATSNLTASGKNVAIAWREPFCSLAKLPTVSSGPPDRARPRTRRTQQIAEILVDHRGEGANNNKPGKPSRAA